jgi:hypothetical protein
VDYCGLDGAADQITPVLELPSDMRIGTVTGYLRSLDQMLSQPRFAGSGRSRRVMLLPEQFTDRQQDRPGAPDFTDSVCWHLLLGDLEPVRAIAEQARNRLAAFTGHEDTRRLL